MARTEIFGPVLVIVPYHDKENAIRIANDCFGLAGNVMSGSLQSVGRQNGHSGFDQNSEIEFVAYPLF